MGDMPIFVAHDSADVWANPELFSLDSRGETTVVAGVPPDYFSPTGQRWGNPLYRWKEHEASGYSWWIERFRMLFGMVDIVRVDHFRGFESYWEVPAVEQTAIHGAWVKGPGSGFFEVLLKQLGPLPIVAEDLGIVTPEVERLRDDFGFPGMRVLHFAFGGDGDDNTHLPANVPENCIIYTGTHDNDTTVGWMAELKKQAEESGRMDQGSEYRRVLDYLQSSGEEIHWDLIRAGMQSRANTCIVPVQDLLGTDSSTRLNTPGEPAGNWRWRLREHDLTERIMARMLDLTCASDRMCSPCDNPELSGPCLSPSRSHLSV